MTTSNTEASELPPLPEPRDLDGARWGYDADDMHNYGVDCFSLAAQPVTQPTIKETLTAPPLVWSNDPRFVEEIQSNQRDAARYLWLNTRFVGADFVGHWAEACFALVFELPTDMYASTDLDATIDAALSAGKGDAS